MLYILSSLYLALNAHTLHISTELRTLWNSVQLTTSAFMCLDHGQGQSRWFHIRKAIRPQTPCNVQNVCQNAVVPVVLADIISRSQLEGNRKPRSFTELLENPELQFHGVQSSWVLHGSKVCVRNNPSSLKYTFRPLCYMSTYCGQQAFDYSFPYFLQGFQEFLYVRLSFIFTWISFEFDQWTFLCSRWNEWITLPIRYCDLPLSSQLTFTVWDIGGPRAAIPVGGSTFRMFGKKW